MKSEMRSGLFWQGKRYLMHFTYRLDIVVTRYADLNLRPMREHAARSAFYSHPIKTFFVGTMTRISIFDPPAALDGWRVWIFIKT